MKRDQLVMTVLALLGGLLGGLSANLLSTGFLAFAQQSSTQTKAISAEAFILVDRNGVRRGEWRVTPDNKISLAFLDESNNLRMMLDADSRQAQLWLNGPQWQSFLKSDPIGASLSFGNVLSTPTRLQANASGTSLALSGNKGDVTVEAFPNGHSHLIIRDENNRWRFLASYAFGQSSLKLLDKDGRDTWNAP